MYCKQNRKLIHLYIYTFILLISLIPVLPAAAEEGGIKINSIAQSDLNGDSQPDLTVIDCAFATGHDLILVVDQTGDMPISDNWQEATDFDDDIWLYDVGADGSIQLIVIYRVEDGHETAYVYDDQDSDGLVRYQQTNTTVEILESPHWTARINALSTWLLPDGRLNLNLRIELDGPFSIFDRMPDYIRQSYMQHDGLVDAEFEAVAGSNGVVRYSVLRLLTPVPDYITFQRTGVRFYDNDVVRSSSQTFFPILYLGIDWLNGHIQGIGTIPTPIGPGFWCNDNFYINKGEINDISFECPLANYDLAEDGDAFPELNLRMFYYTVGDPALAVPFASTVDEAVENIYYSWSMSSNDTLNWDYKVGLAGNYTIDEVVAYNDFSLRMVPFAEFPGWITDRTWKLTTFVARENTVYSSSEGIWEWDPLEGVNPILRGDLSPEVRQAGIEYMLGMSATSPDKHFQTITQGFRAERNFAAPAKPILYFSPIDHELHLLGAQWGVWNIAGQRTVEYRDRDSNGYLDEWQYLEGNLVRSQINVSSGYLMYTGDNEIMIKQAAVPMALFESVPPGNHEQWLGLGEQLTTYQATFAPGDLSAMLQQFSGAEMKILGATVRDFRSTTQGFRFVLNLSPIYTIQGNDWLSLGAAPTGEYLVIYDGVFHLEALTPPALDIRFEEAQQNMLGSLTAYINDEIRVNIGNQGLEDAQQVLVLLGASQDGQDITWQAPQTVRVLAGETTPVAFEWAPDAPGEWALQAWARVVDPAPADGRAASDAQVVNVQAAQSTTLGQELSAFRVVAPWQVLILLGCLLGAAGLIGWVMLRMLSKEAAVSHNEADPNAGEIP